MPAGLANWILRPKYWCLVPNTFKYYCDKDNILRQSTHTNDIRDFKEKDANVLEKLHMNYAK